MKIVIFCFLLSVFTISGYSQNVSQTTKDSIDYCELLKNIGSYSNKTVTLKAIYIGGFEKARFESLQNCNDSTTNPNIGIEVEFDDQWIKNTEKKVYDKIMKKSKKKRKAPDFLIKFTVEVTGTLLDKYNSKKYYHFVVSKVISVSSVK